MRAKRPGANRILEQSLLSLLEHQSSSPFKEGFLLFIPQFSVQWSYLVDNFLSMLSLLPVWSYCILLSFLRITSGSFKLFLHRHVIIVSCCKQKFYDSMTNLQHLSRGPLLNLKKNTDKNKSLNTGILRSRGRKRQKMLPYIFMITMLFCYKCNSL